MFQITSKTLWLITSKVPWEERKDTDKEVAESKEAAKDSEEDESDDSYDSDSDGNMTQEQIQSTIQEMEEQGEEMGELGEDVEEQVEEKSEQRLIGDDMTIHSWRLFKATLGVYLQVNNEGVFIVTFIARR